MLPATIFLGILIVYSSYRILSRLDEIEIEMVNLRDKLPDIETSSYNPYGDDV